MSGGGQSQTYSDLSISSLRSSESLNSVTNPYQQQSAITNLDEAVKSSSSLKVAREIVERYDEGVFDDGAGSQTEEDENNSVVIADSDDEDEIAHFDTNDDNRNNNQQQQYLTDKQDNQNNLSDENKTVNLGN